MQIIPTRLFYCKKNRLKYISHLDTMNVFTKALSRSKLPIWYTQGFNPHIYLTILMPLSLGYEGLREPLDLRLTKETNPEEMLARLNKLLPEDMQILNVGTPVSGADDIVCADYEIMIEAENPKESLELFSKFYGRDEIIVEKKTKKKTFDLDIKPYVSGLSLEAVENNLVIKAKIATGNKLNINPRVLVEGFSEFSGQDFSGVYITRENFYTDNGKEFV